MVDFLKKGSLPDLGWFTDPEFRTQVLPKQNFDVVPDLQALWSHKDESSVRLVPNRAGKPRTMGDMSDVHGLLRPGAEDISRRTKLALMRGHDPGKIRKALVEQYGADVVKAHKEELDPILDERGLIGRLYINASDFPRCYSSTDTKNFVHRHAGSARYVVAKDACDGCIHRLKFGASSVCSVFQKEIVVEVPYTRGLAEHIEAQEAARGKSVTPQTQLPPKERIRLALTAPLVESHQTSQRPIHKAENYVKVFEPPKPVVLAPAINKSRANYWLSMASAAGRLTTSESGYYRQRLASADQAAADALAEELRGRVEAPTQVPVYDGCGVGVKGLIRADSLVKTKRPSHDDINSKPILHYLRDQMLAGKSASAIKAGLLRAFSPEILSKYKSRWQPLYRQAGAFGVVYLTQGSFDNCQHGARAIRGTKISHIVKSSVCDGCIHRKNSSCSVYGLPLVDEPSWAVADNALARYQHERLLAKTASARDFGDEPVKAMRVMYAQAMHQTGLLIEKTTQRSGLLKLHQADPAVYTTGAAVKQRIVKRARMLMNEGLFGQRLQQAMQAQFLPDDISATMPELRPVLAEQGLQGVYYIDPEVYSDYGRGCNQLLKNFKNSSVKYLKRSSKCDSCIMRVNDTCSKLAKPLVYEPPYRDKKATQRQVLASGKKTPKKSTTKNPVEEFQLRASLPVEVSEVVTKKPLDIKLGGLYL